MKFIRCVLLIAGCLIVGACGQPNRIQGKAFNTDTQEVENYRYLPVYQLSGEIVPDQLKMEFIAQLEDITYPNTYNLKKHTGRLLPTDYMLKGDFIIYLTNLTAKPINLDLQAVSIEQVKLPLSTRSINIPAGQKRNISLGQIKVDSRLKRLLAVIEFNFIQHQELTFEMVRNRELIPQSVAEEDAALEENQNSRDEETQSPHTEPEQMQENNKEESSISNLFNKIWDVF
jgi:hypothetical protein